MIFVIIQRRRVADKMKGEPSHVSFGNQLNITMVMADFAENEVFHVSRISFQNIRNEQIRLHSTPILL